MRRDPSWKVLVRDPGLCQFEFGSAFPMVSEIPTRSRGLIGLALIVIGCLLWYVQLVRNSMTLNKDISMKNQYWRLEQIQDYDRLHAHKNDSKGTVVFTALFGPRDGLRRQVKEPGVPYFCFTDNETAATLKPSGWQIVIIPTFPELDQRRMSRHVKLMPQKYLPKSTRFSIWIDGTIEFKQKPSKVVQFYLPEESHANFATNWHPLKRAGWKAEVLDRLQLGQDNPDELMQQWQEYNERGVPQYEGLWENNVLVRAETPQVHAFNELWWKEYSTHSPRDQIAMAAALYQDQSVDKTRYITLHRAPFELSWVPFVMAENKVVRKRKHLYRGKLRV